MRGSVAQLWHAERIWALCLVVCLSDWLSNTR